MGKVTLISGDCLLELSKLEPDSIHAICTDPPYGMVEFSEEEMAKLRAKRGGIWRLPPKWDGCERNPLPRFTVLSTEQKKDIERFFCHWAKIVFSKMRPGGHVLIASNPILQMYVQNALVSLGFENRATILRLYNGFRGGDKPKNAEVEFAGVCVTPKGKYEPWLLFRKPISEKTVAQNLRKWGTGGLRMLAGGKPVPDVIASFKTPALERRIAEHPSLKPQHLLRIFVRALLPLGEGIVLDPFMGAGSTLAAATNLGVDTIGMEIDPTFFAIAERAIPLLAALYPGMNGENMEWQETDERHTNCQEQMSLLE